MTTTAKHASRSNGRNSFVPGFEFMSTSMTAASRAYIAAIGKCQSTMWDFMSRRVSADLQHGQNLSKCADLSQVAAAQQAWLRQAFEDCAAEGQKLMDLGTRAAAGWRSKG